MTRRYCEILNMSVAEEEVDYRQFLLGMLFFLGRLGGVVGKGATFYDTNKAQAMRFAAQYSCDVDSSTVEFGGFLSTYCNSEMDNTFSAAVALGFIAYAESMRMCLN